ncbi:MAG: diaminopimelate epimerase [Proteobacteria bacterium]|nr:diaminopimelate epimerase [Pseudomonadota bacterium]
MQLKFAKMHGLGNDFMVIDALTQDVTLGEQQIRAWADRRTGIGFDQLLLVDAPTDPDVDFWYRIYNADGTTAEQCGNGARCVARFVQDQQLSAKNTLRFQTSTGVISTTLKGDNVEVNMGVPSTTPSDVPFLTDTASLSYLVCSSTGEHLITPVSVGNPHGVLFVDDVATTDVVTIGSSLTRHEVFPEGANIGFCRVVDRGFIRLRVFERGVGETRACGTGACAAAIACVLHGHTENKVKVSLPGGKVRITWDGPGKPVILSGPATMVYSGLIECPQQEPR